MNSENKLDTDYELFIIKGSINGCGIAENAFARGYTV